MRHRLVHGYFDIDHEVVWQTTVSDLPELIRRMEGIVREDMSGTPENWP